MSVKYIDSVRGKAAIATRPVQKGEVVLTDVPLLAMRDFDSEATILVCETCYDPLGNTGDQLAHILDRAPTSAELALLLPASPSTAAPPSPTADFIRCECGTAAFCSAQCQKSAPHALLCPAALARESSASGENRTAALAAFKHHAAHTNDVFYLALAFYARVADDVTRFVSSASSSISSLTTMASSSSSSATYIPPAPALQSALAPFRYFAKRPWWDVLQPQPSDADYEPPHMFRAQLEAVLAESLELMRAVLLGNASATTTTTTTAMMIMEDILNTEFYGLVVGMLEMNVLGVEVASPLTSVMMDEECDGGGGRAGLAVLVRDAIVAAGLESGDGHNHADTGEKEREDADDDDEDEDDEDAESLPAMHADLALLLPLHSILNHSCEPNAVIGFAHGRATVTALRAIEEGEEMCADYVHGEIGAARRDALRKWGAEMVCEVGSCAVCDEEDVEEDEE
ncbi:SET and MYND domain-containing protein 5 [Geranomyces michiganensis]|nr:SET and MYND domain-containing protein 5 [Geranomyces michiganensis]